MSIPGDIIECLKQGQAHPEQELDVLWLGAIFEMMKKGEFQPTEEIWAWKIKRREGLRFAHAAMNRHLLPSDFNLWHLADDYGWTVAHTAAKKGGLPPDFDQWQLTNQEGRTVAHVAAKHGHLPEGFDQWHLANQRGWSVAHVAAYYGNIPPNFSQWALVNEKGQSVAEIFLSMINVNFEKRLKLPSHECINFWTAPTSKGKPMVDYALDCRAIYLEQHEAILQAILKYEQKINKERMKVLVDLLF